MAIENMNTLESRFDFVGEQPPQDILEQLKDLLDKITVHYWWKDKDGKYLGCNKNVISLLGLKSQDEILGKTDHEMVWHEDADKLVYNDQVVMNSAKPCTQEERVIIGNKKALFFLVSKAPYRDQNGNIIGTIGASMDITALKETEQLKTEFIRNMEHDIRTPLSGILGLSTHLWEKETVPEKKELLGMLVQASQELLDYSNQILDFSKIDSEVSQVIDKKFDIFNLIKKVISVEKPIATFKKLKLIFNNDPKIPRIIIGDSYRIYRILINLISNAIKFTTEGSVELRTQLVQDKQRQILIRFIVKDTGIGISREKQDFIFERFSRLSPSNKGLYKGIGLGLRVVKQFMEDMNGEIDLMTREGKGTEFICTIPFKCPLTDDFLEEEENKNDY